MRSMIYVVASLLLAHALACAGGRAPTTPAAESNEAPGASGTTFDHASEGAARNRGEFDVARVHVTNPLLRYCRAKYGADPAALGACSIEESAAFERLGPALARSEADPLMAEAKILGSCRRRHDGQLGIDWTMVEHCFAKRSAVAH
jgi:hypothetical protein